MSFLLPLSLNIDLKNRNKFYNIGVKKLKDNVNLKFR